MAATAKAAPDLKRLAGDARGGRKLAKPVLHYSLSWAQDETPDKREMSRAVDRSLEALGLEGHEALIVAHEDTGHPHVHVIANRVDPETGKAAKLGNSKLRLSRWAEGYEREQGRIRCEERVKNNERRRAGEQVLRPTGDRPRHWARVRREGMQPGRARRTRKPRREDQVDVAAWRHGEAEAWEKVEDGRWWSFRQLDTRARKEWATGRAAPCSGGSGSGGSIALSGTGRGDPGPGGSGRGLARGSRPAPQGRAGRAGQGTRRARPGDRARCARVLSRGLVDAERRAWAARETMKERQETGERESGPSIIIPISPRPRGPERGGGGFER